MVTQSQGKDTRCYRVVRRCPLIMWRLNPSAKERTEWRVRVAAMVMLDQRGRRLLRRRERRAKKCGKHGIADIWLTSGRNTKYFGVSKMRTIKQSWAILTQLEEVAYETKWARSGRRKSDTIFFTPNTNTFHLTATYVQELIRSWDDDTEWKKKQWN